MDQRTEKLFDRFLTIYGAQRFATMWAGADLELVKQTWGAALAKFDNETLAKALHGLVVNGNDWPPTLPQFVNICRQFNVQSKIQTQLSGPKAVVSEDNRRKVQEALNNVHFAKPGKEWATKLLKRAQRGERISTCAIQMAKAALNT